MICGQCVLDAFGDSKAEQVIWRRERDRLFAGRADDDPIRLCVRLAAAVRLEQRQMNCRDVLRLTEQAGLGLIDQGKRRDHRRAVFEFERRQECERRRQRTAVTARLAQIILDDAASDRYAPRP